MRLLQHNRYQVLEGERMLKKIKKYKKKQSAQGALPESSRENHAARATSSTSMSVKPREKNTVPRLEWPPCAVSGMSSSTTT